MTTIQRMKSDIATMEKRDMADSTTRNNRNRNDELTVERRSKADKVLEEHRVKNDETTANRREQNDVNPNMALAVFLLIALGFAFGVFLVLA